jgi:hypothetical protein
MEYTITIDAPREKVWQTLWNEDTYKQWTAPFSPDPGSGSHVKTDWKKGSKALFLDDSSNMGMVSTIADNIPNEFMSIKHIGIVINGEEQIGTPESEQWAGSLENYYLKTVNGKTELKVTMTGAEIPEEHREHFEQAWPKSLNILKEIAEKN